jgi:hypothetical protein
VTIHVTSNGQTDLHYYAVDHAGNVEPEEGITVLIGKPATWPEARRDRVESAGAAPAPAQLQEIILLTVSEVKHLPDALWVSGKWYAMINGRSGALMWRSTTPPQIEIAIRANDPHRPACARLIAQGIPAGKALSINGVGTYMNSAFSLDCVSRCENVDQP